MPEELSGVFPVFQTPFLDDDTIDWHGLAYEIRWMHDHGVDGIVMAMVSETLRLSGEERRGLAEAACEIGLAYGPVIISVGAESTKVAVDYARHAESIGASALMAIPPTTVPSLGDELAAYYRGLLDVTSVPVVIQDASGYVGTPMSIGLQAELLEEFPGRVLFKPEAVPIGPRLTELREATGGTARVFEGSGGIALVDSYLRGIVGTMPGAEVCWALVALWAALERGDQRRIDVINGPLTALISLQTGLDGFIAVEKHLLVRQRVFRSARVRGPVGYRLDPETKYEVDRRFGLLREAVGDPVS
ncbi:MAG: dihydrodipicolinate synthase family protein [bacterium]|nr:dihydrodipicolinate synthase family protein [bacterium]